MREKTFKRYAIYAGRVTPQPQARKFDIAAFADKIPPTANWVAMDAIGDVYAYSHRPFIRVGEKRWESPSAERLVRCIIYIDPTGIDWTQALAPVSQPTVNVGGETDAVHPLSANALPQYQYTRDSLNDMGDHHLKSKDETIAELRDIIAEQGDVIDGGNRRLKEALETINRKQAHLENGVALLNQGRDIIEGLQEQLRQKNEGVWSLITRQGEIIVRLIDEKKALRERIEELEAALRKERKTRQEAQDSAADLRDKCHAQEMLLSTLVAAMKGQVTK